MRARHRNSIVAGGVALAAAAALAAGSASPAVSQKAESSAPSLSAQMATAAAVTTATPIKHVVVIFGENISYDHYFGTYPKATNTDGTRFTAKANTPSNNNLISSGKLTSNPNLYTPKRLTPAQAMTCDQNHNYGAEQAAYNNGAMNQFVQKVSVDSCSGGLYGSPGLTMDYYDGNTVTALWNYAQRFAMSDRHFGSGFGPSTPGALNLISGNTHGFTEVDSRTLQKVASPGGYTVVSPDGNGVGTIINDPDPAYDDCSNNGHTSTSTLAAAQSTSKNIGDLLNAKGVTWGWFQGGFNPTTKYAGSGTYATCDTPGTNRLGVSVKNYSPHHNPFAYYKSTSNPHHLPPTAIHAIGYQDQANHQYGLVEFDQALAAGNLPAVSFVKGRQFQDGHAGYSDPLDEQEFLVNTINKIQKSPAWSSTAIVIAYDDSDGWYDHVAARVTNASHDSAHDQAWCNNSTAVVRGGYADRCGPGPRLPLLVLSPYSKQNFVDHTLTTQASILKFIEDNWSTGRIGDASLDNSAGSMQNLFDFAHPNATPLLLNANGSVQ